jgi:hypothetical protein
MDSKMRPAIAAILTFVLTCAAAAQDPHTEEMRARVRGIGQGVMAEVRLAAAGKLTGRVGEIREHEFVLEEVREKKLQDQTIAYADMKSVKAASGKKANHITPIVIAVAGSLAISYLIRVLRR